MEKNLSKQVSKQHSLNGSSLQHGQTKICLVQNKSSSLEQFPILNRGAGPLEWVHDGTFLGTSLVLQQQAYDRAVPSRRPWAFPSAFRQMAAFIIDSDRDSLQGQLSAQLITKLLVKQLTFSSHWCLIPQPLPMSG